MLKNPHVLAPLAGDCERRRNSDFPSRPTHWRARRFRCKCQLLLLLAIYLVNGPFVTLSRAHSDDHSTKYLQTSSPRPVLRSAWMLADPAAQFPAIPRTAAEEQSQLRDHFRLVEEILIKNTPASLEIAVARFEMARGGRLTRDARAKVLAELYSRRMIQIARLREYREAGRFPLNTVDDGSSHPIFVDDRDTACAVGHLMRSSGWEEEVASIARANNFVVVPDVRVGPLFAWILQSGLTQEEAALIQPTYNYMKIVDDSLRQLLLPDATVDQDGLRFSNFKVSLIPVREFVFNQDDWQLDFDVTQIDFRTPVNTVNLASGIGHLGLNRVVTDFTVGETPWIHVNAPLHVPADASSGFIVDRITSVAVPEPSTWVLAVCGCLVFVLFPRTRLRFSSKRRHRIPDSLEPCRHALLGDSA